jgi:hypothetical protein
MIWEAGATWGIMETGMPGNPATMNSQREMAENERDRRMAQPVSRKAQPSHEFVITHWCILLGEHCSTNAALLILGGLESSRL